MRGFQFFSLTVLIATTIAGNCNNSACLLPVVPTPGVVATVTSAATDLPITGATVTLSDNAGTYAMQEGLPGVYSGANGTPGTFTLTAQAGGFQTATRDNIVVSGQPCNVTTVPVQIQMNPN